MKKTVFVHPENILSNNELAKIKNNDEIFVLTNKNNNFGEIPIDYLVDIFQESKKIDIAGCFFGRCHFDFFRSFNIYVHRFKDDFQIDFLLDKTYGVVANNSILLSRYDGLEELSEQGKKNIEDILKFKNLKDKDESAFLLGDLFRKVNYKTDYYPNRLFQYYLLELDYGSNDWFYEFRINNEPKECSLIKDLNHYSKKNKKLILNLVYDAI